MSSPNCCHPEAAAATQTSSNPSHSESSQRFYWELLMMSLSGNQCRENGSTLIISKMCQTSITQLTFLTFYSLTTHLHLLHYISFTSKHILCCIVCVTGCGAGNSLRKRELYWPNQEKTTQQKNTGWMNTDKITQRLRLRLKTKTYIDTMR